MDICNRASLTICPIRPGDTHQPTPCDCKPVRKGGLGFGWKDFRLMAESGMTAYGLTTVKAEMTMKTIGLN